MPCFCGLIRIPRGPFIPTSLIQRLIVCLGLVGCKLGPQLALVRGCSGFGAFLCSVRLRLKNMLISQIPSEIFLPVQQLQHWTVLHPHPHPLALHCRDFRPGSGLERTSNLSLRERRHGAQDWLSLSRCLLHGQGRRSCLCRCLRSGSRCCPF